MIGGIPKPPSAKSLARQRLVTEEGDIYAARTTDGLWMKIGFSQNVPERIRALNAEYNGYVVFELVATTRGLFKTEQKLHRAMKPLHQVHIGAGKEFYPMMPAVLGIVSGLIEKPARLEFTLDAYLSFLKWCRQASKEAPNKIPALHGHREIIERHERALERIYARTREIVAAREAEGAAA